MTPSTRSSRKPERAITQAVVPAALVALLAVVGVMAWYARQNEHARTTTAENALRDYAAFAAWQFGRQVRSHLVGHISMSVGPIRRHAHAGDASAASPRMLSEGTRECDCGFRGDLAFAFRLDPPSGAVVLDTALDASTDRALRRLASELWRTDPRQVRAESMRMEGMGRTGWLRFDSLAGKSYVIAYTAVGGRNGTPLRMYGIAADVRHLEDDFRRLVNQGPLLPPSLVGKKPNAEVLALSVFHPRVGSIYATERAEDAMGISAADTLDPALGGLVTTVSLRPDMAQTLLIGGVPTSRASWYLGLLLLSAVVASVAILQWRRGRELGRLREQFVASVSHELRTPLTQISMLGETMLLDRHRSPDEGRRYLSVIVREARRLTHLVESVLRFSRPDNASHGLRIEARDIVPDVRDTVDAFAPLAAASATRVELSLPAVARTYADAGAVRQILLNLLDNAMKYGPRGQTTRVAVRPTDQEVQVSVEDEGPGIAPGDRERVFDAFTRLQGDGVPNVTGAGIGLSVVRDLVRAQGGRVWISDASHGPRSGTAVTFTLRAAYGE